MTYLTLLLMFPALLFYFTAGENILVVLTFPVVSHCSSFMPIFKELALRGHNVTVISSYPQKEPVPNLTDIVIPNLTPKLRAAWPKQILEMGTVYFHLFKFWKYGIAASLLGLNTEKVQWLINDQDSKFDLVVIEALYFQESFLAFGHKYNAPVINIATFFYGRVAHITGNYLPPSYVPIMYTGMNDRMTFTERSLNAFYYYWDILVYEFYYLRKQDKLMREMFKYPGAENLPPIKELLTKMSLTLLEHDLATNYPMALHNNVVTFAGVKFMEVEKLPDDIQKIMDETNDGVILFSMGSFFQLSFLKPEMSITITKTMTKLNHKVIMKLKDPMLQNLTSDHNIVVRDWVPQRSILAHPNCKLFITHGGMHGMMESIYHGVPMVGIPLVMDQKLNMKFVETIGAGVILDVHSINEEQILSAVEEVLNNPKYKENARKRSAIIKDSPIDSLDNAIYWIEYVIRHKGAPHLRPAVLDLYWFQYLMLDVMVLYLILFIILGYIIKKLLTFLKKCYNFIIFFMNTRFRQVNQKTKIQ